MSNSYIIGYVGLLEDAPLLVAYAQGWFQKENLHIELSRELGWATLNAKLTKGNLTGGNISALSPLILNRRNDRAQHSGLHVLTMTSFGGLRLVTSLEIASALGSKKNPPVPLRVGVGVPIGDSHLFLRAWQQARGLQPNDVNLVPIAVTQFVDALKEGYVHGFIAAEPVVSEATLSLIGTSVAKSHDYYPYHARSVFAVKESFTTDEPQVCETIRRVMQRATAFCGDPTNWAAVRDSLPVHKSTEMGFDLKKMEMPMDMLFDVGSARVTERAGVDFLVRACLASDSAWREQEVRAAIARAYKRFFVPVPI
jgi:ABC-type nitrate/sulfonate/bicarbonate transport system substrate-binding protein